MAGTRQREQRSLDDIAVADMRIGRALGIPGLLVKGRDIVDERGIERAHPDRTTAQLLAQAVRQTGLAVFGGDEGHRCPRQRDIRQPRNRYDIENIASTGSLERL